MQRLWDDIGGTEDALALYIKRNPRWRYNPAEDGGHRHSYRPERVAAILWLPSRPGTSSVFDYVEDSQYEIGCPVAAANTTCGPQLRELVFNLYGSKAHEIWGKLRGSMTGGRPFQIDEGPYERLGDALTSYYSAVAVTA